MNLNRKFWQKIEVSIVLILELIQTKKFRISIQMQKNKQQALLNFNEKVLLVTQDGQSYKEFLEANEKMKVLKTIQKSLAEIKNGQSKSSNQFFHDFF